MRLVVSWLRDFVDVAASADEIADTLGLRGFEVAAIEPLPDGDAVIDFEVTANRPDCLSVLGLAREVATAYDVPLRAKTPESSTPPTGDADRVSVTIEAADLCPRYAAAVAEVTPAASPGWMTERLKAAGVRPIGAIVDITNYVLLELGHPMHAFDLATLDGAELRVRRAGAGETITTLDGIERHLDADMLVIADRRRPQAVAGIMGGAASEVSASTKTVVFESAYFAPTSVRRTSKRLGLKTEASFRFERGADIGVPVAAIGRALDLVHQLGAGRVHPPIVDRYPARRDPARIHLRRTRISLVLGVDVPDTDIERILRRLGLDVVAAPDGWNVVAPTFRVDLLREIDLIEEVGRHAGFDALPTTFPVVTAPAPPPDPRIPRDRLVRRVMTAAGLSEAVTFGFIEANAAEPFVAPGSPAVAIANPLSGKFDTLRTSLLPGLIDAVAHNRRHGRDDVALFEIGTRFTSAGETRGVALAWTGAGTPSHWSAPARGVDFFDVKGVVSQLCEALGARIRFEPVRMPYFVVGQAAAIHLGSDIVGHLGRIAPAVVGNRGAPQQDDVFAAEVNLDRLTTLPLVDTEPVRPLPRHPSVVRDLSIVVDDSLPVQIIRDTIHAAAVAASAPLVDIGVFDRYQGKGVPDGRVSLSLRLTFRSPERTLTDVEVQQATDAMLATLVKEHRAVQR